MTTIETQVDTVSAAWCTGTYDYFQGTRLLPVLQVQWYEVVTWNQLDVDVR